MIKDNRRKGEYARCKYYRRFDQPIRNVLDNNGRVFGADTLDVETGELVKKATLIEADFHDPYVDEITEKEFYEAS